MACQGGCIAGPSVITNPKVELAQLAKYVEKGAAVNGGDNGGKI
jgi:iron only hydrogenase large subunit-like protein